MDDAHKFSLKDKIKQALCFSCCFTANGRETLRSTSESASSTYYNSKRPLHLIGASSQWIKSRASVDIPEIKDKCRNIFGRIGCSNSQPNHRRRRSSTDFRYDPLSYALNFEDDSCGNPEDDNALKDFSSRLPSTPLRSSTDPSFTTAEDYHPSQPMATFS